MKVETLGIYLLNMRMRWTSMREKNMHSREGECALEEEKKE